VRRGFLTVRRHVRWLRWRFIAVQRKDKRRSSRSPTASSSSPITCCATVRRYRELGVHYFDRLNTERLTRYHTKRLAALGYTMTLAKHAA
jgi:hypothetical protein